VLDVRRFENPFHGFGEDEEGDEEEKESVDKTRDNLCSHITVRKRFASLPPGDDGGGKTGEQSRAVEKHME